METVLNIEVSVLERCPYREVGLYIYFTNISEGTVFLLQGLAYNAGTAQQVFEWGG